MALQSARQETSQEEDRGDGERERFLCAVQESPKVTTTQITCLTPQPHERYCQLPRHGGDDLPKHGRAQLLLEG